MLKDMISNRPVPDKDETKDTNSGQRVKAVEGVRW